MAVLFAGLTVAPLLALPRRPLLAWRLTVVALATCTFNAPAGAAWPWTPVLALGSLLVLAVVATRVDRPELVWVGLLTLVPVVALVDPDHRIDVVVPVLTVLVLGDLVRGNRLSRRALAAQTALSEREQERRAVLEERTRIARELHDVVAHHMSMIAVQAETAPYRLADVPDAGPRRVRRASRGSAREALTDMRRLLGVLRSESTGPETAPQPGLADLAAMVDAARRAGLPVTLDAGQRRPAGRPHRSGWPRTGSCRRRWRTRPGTRPAPRCRVTVRPGAGRVWRSRVDERRRRTGRSDAGRAAAPGTGWSACASGPPLLGGTFAAGPRRRRRVRASTAAAAVRRGGPGPR